MSEYNRNSKYRHSGSFWEFGNGKKKSWFASCSPKKKWAISLLFLFVIVWCFFSGYVVSNALLPDLSDKYVTSKDVINSYFPDNQDPTTPIDPDQPASPDDPSVPSVTDPDPEGDGVCTIMNWFSR